MLVTLALYDKGGIEKRRQYPFYEKWLLSLPVLFLSVFLFLCFAPNIFSFASNIFKKPDRDFLSSFVCVFFWFLPAFVFTSLIATFFREYKTAQFSVKDLRFFIACGIALIIGGLLFFAKESPHPLGYFFLFYFAVIAVIIFVSHLLAIAVHASIEGQKEEEQKKGQIKEANKNTRVAFFSSLSSLLDPYGAALVKYPLSYYEAGSPLQAKIRADIEALFAFLQRVAPEDMRAYLDSEIGKGNSREPATIILSCFSAAALSARYADNVPLSDMQALLFALWKDLLNVSTPEEITPQKIWSPNAVPIIAGQQFSALKSTYGERIAKTLQKTIPNDGLKHYINDFARTLEFAILPQLARSGFQVLGYIKATGSGVEVEDAAIPPDFRFQHLYITGKTGAGKTTLLKNLISQDINRGDGVIVFSPENDLFENLLHCIPRDRAQDLIYFDPSDTTPPIVGFNPFHFEPGEDFTQKAGEVATIFSRAMGAELGVNMKTLFENSVRALIQYPEATIADFDALLDAKDDTFRARLIASPHVDERTKNFFKTKFKDDKFYRASADRVLSRLDAFFRPPLLDILSNHSIAYSDVLNASQRILFFNLSKLRGVNASICGQLLIAQLQQTFMQRDAIPEASRLPYHLYMDEFQVYASEAEETIKELFNRVRKYKVSITLSNQNMDDIPASLLSSIIANVGSLACFLLPADKAIFFAKELQLKDWDGKIDAVSLQNLNTGEIFFRQPKKKRGFSVRVPSQPILTPNDPETEKESYPTALKATSKHRYGKTPAPASPPTPPRQNPRESGNEGAEFDIE